ncbi:phosphoribosylanthranilate isomerase [Halococcus hamelinensis]|uniref:N-(5'-phosphoribosyl)anthranilate isomerase n=1 Tax=Halococcus hamelinensis 100A6 TaxID=1132509 RepID=M0LRY8_9EURY|nr:phosphoribosylanthranilate isomerase [Halococcus hamelinensis]EMA36241.1 phosphoribosylanthranilate isomerase [Halococcus hamelinensis 100A6]
MTRAKLCGLTRGDDLHAAVDAGADMVGFVTGVPIETPRELDPEAAADLVDRVPDGVTSVLVTMPDSPAAGADLVDRVGADAIQVHGFSAEEIDELAAATDRSVFAAVDAADDLSGYTAADAIVLDSTDEHGAGGTGETHDWERAREVVADLDTPVLLAGGLTPENVASAVRTAEPFGVDVSSGVEEAGGKKDHDALRRFVERATVESVRA